MIFYCFFGGGYWFCFFCLNRIPVVCVIIFIAWLSDLIMSQQCTIISTDIFGELKKMIQLFKFKLFVVRHTDEVFLPATAKQTWLDWAATAPCHGLEKDFFP